MPIFHLHAGVISRSTGRSAVQNAAYITGSKLNEERRNLVANYSNRSSKIISGTLASEHTPAWAKTLNAWNYFETFEDAYAEKYFRNPLAKEKYLGCAQTGQTFVYALPKELNKEVCQELVENIASERFVTRNLVVTYGIHMDEGNPHVHLLISRRAILENGEIAPRKDREIMSRVEHRITRKFFADRTNEFLEREGIEARVDHRSFAERGIELTPTQHEGWFAHKLLAQGEVSRIIEDNKEITQENKEKIALYPDILLKELTNKQATFTELGLLKLVQKRLQDDAHLGSHVFEQTLKSALMVGEDINGQRRFTSPDYAQKEKQLFTDLKYLCQQKSQLTIDQSEVDKLLNTTYAGFNEQQKEAVRLLCENKSLGMMIGRAGTGKTTALKAVVELHQQAGYEVLGMALAASAADNLGRKTKCQSETIAFYLDKWDRYRQYQETILTTKDSKIRKDLEFKLKNLESYQLQPHHLVLVDEAGMVGTRQWHQLVGEVKRIGAKLLKAGDDHQFKAIESGDVTRKAIEIASQDRRVCELSTIIRQKTEWMKEATTHFANLNTTSALALYEQHGHIISRNTLEELREVIAEEYVSRLKQNPTKEGLVLTYTNAECTSLNASIRSSLRLKGMLKQTDEMILKDKGFTTGDRIVFLTNDRYQRCVKPLQSSSPFSVKNGTYGIIEKIEALEIKTKDRSLPSISTYRVSVKAIEDSGIFHSVQFILNDYENIDHAYAVTEHKSQGQTLDWALVLASKHMDALAAYVAMTRHEHGVQLYYSHELFPEFADLQRSLSKINDKDLVVDYSITDQHKEHWLNVQDYKILGQELVHFFKAIGKIEKPTQEDWIEIEEIKKERLELAKIILEDWDVHKAFIRQAGFTKETLQIASGLKVRPLSLAEQKAQFVIEDYGSTALQCRDLWQAIKKTHPGARAKLHPDYEGYKELQAERGSLANLIAQAPALHRIFIKDISKDLGYGFSIIQKQAEAYQEQILLGTKVRKLSSPEQKHFETLQAYILERNLTAQAWQKIKELKKEYESSVVRAPLKEPLALYETHLPQRDKLAFDIVHDLDAYKDLCQKLDVALPYEKLFDQADQYYRTNLIQQVKHSDSLLVQGLAASELWQTFQEEKALGQKQITYAAMKAAGLTPKVVHTQAIKFDQYQLSLELTSKVEKQAFQHLETYDVLQDTSKQHYNLCVEDAKENDIKVWESAYYPLLKQAHQERDSVAYQTLKEISYPTLSSLASRLEIDITKLDEQSHAHHIRTLCQRFQNTGSSLEKALIAQELADWQTLETESKQRISLRCILDQHLDWKELNQAQKIYEDITYRDALSPSEHQAFDRVKNYAELRRETSLTFAQVAQEVEKSQSAGIPLKPWNAHAYTTFSNLKTEMNAVAASLQENLLQHQPFFEHFKVKESLLDTQSHRHDLEQLVGFFKEEDHRAKFFAAHELKEWLELDPELKSKDTIASLMKNKIHPSALHTEIQEMKESFAKRNQSFSAISPDIHEPQQLKDSVSEVLDPSLLSSQKSSLKTFISFEDVNEKLKENLPELALHLLGEPTSKRGSQWRYGRKGSLSIFMMGPKKGLVSDFSEGQHGGPFSLIERERNIKGKEALEWAHNWLGKTQTPEFAHFKMQTSHLPEKTKWQPIFPIPQEIKVPDLLQSHFLSYMLKDKNEQTRFSYKDEQGKLLGYVVRLEDQEGNKITPTLTYCENERGQKHWRWQGFGENRPLYGLDHLAENPDKPILVVEGEKTAEAARPLFPNHTVITWLGGSGAVHKTDWSPLKDHTVILFPDNDEPGFKAAQKIEEILKGHGNEKVGIVDLPSNLPPKWDLADPLPESCTLDHLKELVQQKTEKVSLKSTHSPAIAEISDEKIEAIAQKYGLTDYLEPKDQLQKPYIRFSKKDFESLQGHYQFDVDPEKLLEKIVITGIVQYFTTTLDRLHGKLSEARLQETYDKATTAATLYQQALEQGKKPVGINKVLDQANAYISQEKETLLKLTDSLPEAVKEKNRGLLKEKSRLQIQFARKLNDEQTKELHSKVELHHEKTSAEPHHQMSLRQHHFGESHNLTTFKHEIMHQNMQQQKALETQQEIHKTPPLSLNR